MNWVVRQGLSPSCLVARSLPWRLLLVLCTGGFMPVHASRSGESTGSDSRSQVNGGEFLMFSRSAVRQHVWVSAAILIGALVLPTDAWAQSRKSGATRQDAEKKFMVESAAGITLPASRLGEIADPGPNVGLQLGFAVSRRLALTSTWWMPLAATSAGW